ncbi:hypothetical protein [Myroides pelagicus]|uniref:C1q domain-containing protein n=1 Tax=Myroides pelagicus TaxID=270914 RepID=A0A7K1GTC2_9FLAO|nr:hypothetical protein [Myroides pelagicus]MTH30984.1 hypothetical protein [Myroides pelagicus]
MISLSTYAQVGINTQLPLKPLHIDGGKDNVKGVNPTAEHAKNDEVIDQQGNVGLGVFTSTTKLDINGKLRVVDGQEAANKLLRADSQGVYYWEAIPYATLTVLGTFEKEVVNALNTEALLYSNGLFTLTKGKWIVNAVVTLSMPSDTNLWLHAYLSSIKTAKQSTGFTFLGPSGSKTAYAARLILSTDDVFGLVSGSSIIDVTAPQATIYLLIEDKGSWKFTPNYWENYFYAIPVL